MAELSGFSSDYFYPCRDKDPDVLWCKAIYDTDWREEPTLPAIILFTGAGYQKREKCSPFSFAKWLKDKGESIVKTTPVTNENTGSRLTAFLWTPSAKFRKFYAKVINKNNDKFDSEGSN